MLEQALGKMQQKFGNDNIVTHISDDTDAYLSRQACHRWRLGWRQGWG